MEWLGIALIFAVGIGIIVLVVKNQLGVTIERGRQLKYLGGLPSGRPGVYLRVKPEGRFLRIGENKDEQRILLENIRAIEAASGKSISAGRVLAMGLGGLIWKANKYYLIITYDQHGISSQACFEGPPEDLDRLRQDIMRVRGEELAATET